MSKKKKILITVVSVILGLVLALVSTVYILRWVGKRKFVAGSDDVSIPQTTAGEDSIEYEGKKYKLNKNIVTVLILGIDKEISEGDIGYGKNGQADTIMLAAIDTRLKTINIIPISRETMVNINEYSTTGDYVGNRKRQICLSYAYGGNPDESSKNMMTSVKRLLYGININSYFTIDLEGVAAITNAMGGVRLNALEEFSYGGTTYKAGKSVNLKGKQAVAYLRIRGKDTEANNRRMEKHKQFVTAALNTAGNKIMDDFSLFTKYYNTVTPYISTNLDFSRLTYLTTELLTADIGNSIEFKKIEGTTVLGEKWMEFTPDEQSLTRTVIEVFYQEVK